MVGSFLTTATGLSMVASQNMGIVGVWACLNVFLTSGLAGHLLLSTKLRKYMKKAFGREEKAMLKKNAVLVYVCYIYGKDCTGIYEMGARLWNRVSLFV